MRKINTLEELKKIQLDILLSFHKFCTENNINYSLAAGTLIGAIRHKGFIPWDDDIDVYLLREEYNKLVASYPCLYNGRYKFVSLERDKKWHRAYGKLYDNMTIEVEKTQNVYADLGVGIDVFPIDDVPDNHDEWCRYEKKRRFLRDIMTLKSLSLLKERSIKNNVIVLLGRLLLFFLPFSLLARLMDRKAQMHNNKGYKHVYENCLGVYNSEKPWLKEDIIEVIDTPFEDNIIKIMKGYDDYLTIIYGDYMKLPPVEKQISHHAFNAFWK